MTERPDLSAYIVDEATPEQIARQWSAVEARLHARPRRLFLIPLLLAGAAATAIFYPWTKAGLHDHWTSQTAPESFALADGSRLELQPSTDVRLLGQADGEAHLQLVRGGARFEVRRNPARRFQVSAAGIDVVVIGTIFSVSLDDDPAAPRVSVERGEVEVRRHEPAGLLARLHAGEAWPPAAPTAETPREASPPPPPAEAKATAPEPPAANPGRGVSRAAPDLQVAATDPRRLLERANSARRSGNVAQAADALELLRSRYPRDRRAALASFELGRLRMDELHDLPGAIEALQHSIALAPHGVFREDAEACLATAFARQHQRVPCEKARRAYLDRYPEGTHAAAMAALDCGGR